MPFNYFPGGTSIKRPRCSRSTSRMMLARISSGPVGLEHRWFECPGCKSVQDEVVASDRMNRLLMVGLPENSGVRSDGKPSTDRHSGSAGAMSLVMTKESEL